MKYLINNWWRSVDQKIVIAISILMSIGLLLVITSSERAANNMHLNKNYFIIRHVIFLGIALVLMFILSNVRQQTLRRISLLGLIFNIIILAIIVFYGREVKGAKRWISIFNISYQASEIIRPFFFVVVSKILSLDEYTLRVRIYVVSILYFILAFLIIIQPDFGMLVIITIVFVILLFVAGIPIMWFVISVMLSVVVFMASYFMFPHISQRINKYIYPQYHDNYQVKQSLASFYNGSIFGKGPGEGEFKRYLPDSHTDFIFAVSGEEFGVFISLIIILCFAFITIYVLLKAYKEENNFVKLTLLSIISNFGIQSCINIGVTLDLLPTKGMTLPFISYGGSSLIARSIEFGIILALTKTKTSLIKYKILNSID
ncbi:FtsW/RodA/SpoVE family cell cycle protein [Rickettsia endosymbiont of Cardiosporidium cionae]|uniref:FtsW/RodA/SpoVE family cell cycle protein n=1 Tax=Rickettsia endosymbiont of Cardiosporidium cionae TaxID=2777155 RepID=UPI001895079A|nr:putative peptidoglycan glycosyltransferase FtsW [Rickettsia endosymbiont of Cardiosporidium cionae]KAF8818657.1 putative lipid II flippase FtsW [Rickettsia endosymbiont of Cardiosporidium cionae]